MNNHCVYLITFPNKKVYVGITNNFKHRMYQHKKESLGKSKIKLYLAIRKYGFENCKTEILHDGLTREQAMKLEIETIKQKNSIIGGYNVAPGGGLSPMVNPEVAKRMKETKNSPEFIEKISKKMKEILASDEQKAKSSVRSKRLWSEKKDKMMEAILRGVETRKKNGINIEKVKASWTDARRENISSLMKARMAFDSERKKSRDALNSVESIAKRNSTKRTPEWRAKQSMKLKQYNETKRKMLELQKLSTEALRYLESTDWMVLRSIDTGIPYPEEIKQARAEARTKVVK